MRMGAASQTPTLLLRVGVPRKLSTWGCPSLHPFALPHAPQWGCAQPEGNTRGAPLPFGTPPPLHMSMTLRGVPHAQPLCAPPFGCHKGAVPHVGRRVQGGIRKVGRAGVVHVGRRTGSCSHPLQGNVRTGGHAESEGVCTIQLPSPCKRSAMGGEWVSAYPLPAPHAPPRMPSPLHRLRVQEPRVCTPTPPSAQLNSHLSSNGEGRRRGGQPWEGWEKQRATSVAEGEGARAHVQPGKWATSSGGG